MQINYSKSRDSNPLLYSISSKIQLIYEFETEVHNLFSIYLGRLHLLDNTSRGGWDVSRNWNHFHVHFAFHFSLWISNETSVDSFVTFFNICHVPRRRKSVENWKIDSIRLNYISKGSKENISTLESLSGCRSPFASNSNHSTESARHLSSKGHPKIAVSPSRTVTFRAS